MDKNSYRLFVFILWSQILARKILMTDNLLWVLVLIIVLLSLNANVCGLFGCCWLHNKLPMGKSKDEFIQFSFIQMYSVYLGFKFQCFLNVDKLLSATHFSHPLVAFFHNLRQKYTLLVHYLWTSHTIFFLFI